MAEGMSIAEMLYHAEEFEYRRELVARECKVGPLHISRWASTKKPPQFVPGVGWICHPTVAYALGFIDEREANDGE